MTKKLSTSQLRKNLWRMCIYTYAERLSQGDWIAYNWLKYTLWQIQEAVMKGNARIIINAPPRHGKSTGIAKWLPVWYLDLFPQNRVLLGSHGDEFASEWGMSVRDMFINNPLTRTNVSTSLKKADNWRTTDDGGMKTMGVGGSVVGRGGNLIVITDPHKSWTEVQSPTYRKRTFEWFESDVYTRCEPNASIVVEHTRWHDEDLSGYLVNEHGDDWIHIHLPALAEDDDILGRLEGQPLCPERFDRERLEKLRTTMIDVMWGCLYQQRPAPAGGNIVNSDWFKYWDTIPEHADEWLQSWDCTFKKTGTSMVVGQVWCRKGPNFYLIDQLRDKLSFTETISSIQDMCRRWPQATQLMIEDKANGTAIIDTLKDLIPGIIEENPVKDKTSRLIAVSHLIKGGNVYIPDPRVYDWVSGYKHELSTIPGAKYDDQGDSTSQALKHLSRFDSNLFTTDIQLSLAGEQASTWSAING